MSRTIPVALQAHLDQAVTTTCRLLRIALRDGRVFGITSLDADVTYDDGRGAVTYSANQGVDVSAISASADMSVSNAEAQSLLVTTAPGITEAMIEAGELRDAEWTLYLVNYRDLGMGHVILGAGDVGEVTKRWGLMWQPELLSYSVRLNQPVGTHWSRTCRAIDGSPAEGQLGCGRTIATYAGTVTAVGAENDRQFTGNHTAGAFPFAPGKVRWVTGPNAGRVGFVEVHATGVVTLGNAMPYPITVGNTYTIEDTCPRTWAACVARGNQLNFKGEPLIPTGDAASVSTPGAQSPRQSVITQVAGSIAGQGPFVPFTPDPPDVPSVPVPLSNPDFEGTGGWTTVISQTGQSFAIVTGSGHNGSAKFGRFTLDGVNPGPQADPTNGDSMQVANTASGRIANPGFVTASIWVRCTAFAGDSTDEWQCGVILEEYSDAALTNRIGRAEQFPLRSSGTTNWNKITTSMVAGAYVRMVVRAVATAAATIEIDNATWDLEEAA